MLYQLHQRRQALKQRSHSSNGSTHTHTHTPPEHAHTRQTDSKGGGGSLLRHKFDKVHATFLRKVSWKLRDACVEHFGEGGNKEDHILVCSG